jgi:hypothetical protein
MHATFFFFTHYYLYLHSAYFATVRSKEAQQTHATTHQCCVPVLSSHTYNLLYQLTLQQREAKKQDKVDAINFEKTAKAGGPSSTTPTTPYGSAGTKQVC